MTMKPIRLEKRFHNGQFCISDVLASMALMMVARFQFDTPHTIYDRYPNERIILMQYGSKSNHH
jgi:hypothetical protein